MGALPWLLVCLVVLLLTLLALLAVEAAAVWESVVDALASVFASASSVWAGSLPFAVLEGKNPIIEATATKDMMMTAAAAVSKREVDRREAAAVVAGYVAEVVTPAKAVAEAVQAEVQGIDAVMESWTEAEWWLTKPAAPTSVEVAAVDRKSVKI